MSYFDDNEDHIVYGRGRRARWTGFGRDPRYNEESRTTECKRCGKSGLRWHKEDGRWVLMESQYKVHHCDTSKVADDFDVVQP